MASIRSALLPQISRASAKAGPSRLPLAACPVLLPTSGRSSRGPKARAFTTTLVPSSGSNKWSKIKHKKGVLDAKRSLRFGNLCKDIYQALKPPNSSDPAVNARLAMALTRAKEGGVTKAHIEGVFAKVRSVTEGTGKEMIYEAIGPAGREALIIQCISDNANRTIQTIGKTMEKFKFRIAPVLYLFDKRGLITIDPSQSSKSFDELFDIALEGGAEDVVEAENDDGDPQWEVYTSTTDLGSLTNLFNKPPHNADFSLISAELAYIPSDPLEVSEDGAGIPEAKAESIMSLVEALEDDGDVVKVWTNLA